MFPDALAVLVEPPLFPARVVGQDRDAYTVAYVAPDGVGVVNSARLGGSFRHDVRSSTDLPAVGDYVALELSHESLALVRGVLPRRNLLARRAVGLTDSVQPIAANLDTLFITVALNRDFNLRRIERYLAGAHACGVPAVVLLTKSDLADDVAAYVDAAWSVAGSAPVVALCALDGLGLEALDPFRGPDRTVAFAGSSGAGKSTLINALFGAEVVATGAVRDDDGRGRHTTTRRQLLQLPDGTCIVDTPGMREFGLLEAANGVAVAFGDVAALAATCRFRDCRHEREPGCAVVGGLDETRLASYRKLNREAAFEARKAGDREAQLAEKRRWKAIHKAVRSFDKRWE